MAVSAISVNKIGFDRARADSLPHSLVRRSGIVLMSGAWCIQSGHAHTAGGSKGSMTRVANARYRRLIK
jgi:hypothetical protein